MKESLMIRMGSFSLLRTGLLKRYFNFYSPRLHNDHLLDLTVSSFFFFFCAGEPQSGLYGKILEPKIQPQGDFQKILVYS